MKGVVKVKSQRRALHKLVACLAAACLVLSGCAGAGAMGGSGNTVPIAMVSNSQMTDARKLASRFEAENPDIKLKFITLSENQARAKITASTAMGGGEFDVAMISNYETPTGSTAIGLPTACPPANNGAGVLKTCRSSSAISGSRCRGCR